MSISGLSASSQASLGLINGTGEVETTPLAEALSQSQATTPLSQALAQSQDTGQGTQSSGISQVGQTMSQLSQLATSDPSQFKTTAQNISDQLATAAKNTSNSTEAGVLNKMSENFADAAKTGNMSSLQSNGHHHHHSGSYTASGATGSNSTSPFATLGGSGSMESTFSTIGTIISGALSEASTGSSSSTTGGTAAAVSTTSSDA
jgi:hypothetical protein